MKIIILSIKIIISLLLLLISIALFAGYTYLQGIFLLLIITLLFYRPKLVAEKIKSGLLRKYFRLIIITFIFFIFLIINLTAKKGSIYRSIEHKHKLYSIYDKKMQDWPKDYKDIFINTNYGKVHIVSIGNMNNPPILMLHAAAMGAHSWAENLPALLDNFMIYAVDKIGEGNKSELDDALIYPGNGKELSKFYADIADSLKISSSYVIGASNGGFIAMNYAFYFPEKVKSLVLLGPMGLTQLSNTSIMMMAIPSMYPFAFIKDNITTWALGNSPKVLNKYGDWFDCILESTIPSIAKPEPMTIKQKNNIKIPVLLFLGTNDPIVGDAQFASNQAREFPNIRIVVLESGHLISVERKDIVNEELARFLKIEELSLSNEITENTIRE